jgi:DNA-binding NarL/FixJ family response regulator
MNPTPIRLVLVEDHLLQLDGLKMLLEKSPGINVVNTFNDPKIFLSEVDALAFDILLADLHMPDVTGLDLAEELKKRHHPAKTILLTMQRGTRFMQRAEKIGVEGYALKSIPTDELIKIIHRVHAGETVYDAEAKKYSQEDDTHIKSTLTVNEKPENLLSDREKEILILVCQEYSSSQIAEKLFISTGTVDTHRKNILLKIGVSNTVGLVKYALRNGLLNQHE